MAVNVSYFCRHCGLHKKKADHTKCNKILREQAAAELKAKNLSPEKKDKIRVRNAKYVQKNYKERDDFADYVSQTGVCKELFF